MLLLNCVSIGVRLMLAFIHWCGIAVGIEMLVVLIICIRFHKHNFLFFLLGIRFILSI